MSIFAALPVFLSSWDIYVSMIMREREKVVEGLASVLGNSSTYTTATLIIMHQDHADVVWRWSLVVDEGEDSLPRKAYRALI